MVLLLSHLASALPVFSAVSKLPTQKKSSAEGTKINTNVPKLLDVRQIRENGRLPSGYLRPGKLGLRFARLLSDCTGERPIPPRRDLPRAPVRPGDLLKKSAPHFRRPIPSSEIARRTSISASTRPVPSATALSGSVAMCTGKPVS